MVSCLPALLRYCLKFVNNRYKVCKEACIWRCGIWYDSAIGMEYFTISDMLKCGMWYEVTYEHEVYEIEV